MKIETETGMKTTMKIETKKRIKIERGNIKTQKIKIVIETKKIQNKNYQKG